MRDIGCGSNLLVERKGDVMTFQTLYDLAHTAGMRAANECVPTPMVVNQHADMMNDSSPVVESWKVDDGPCGFAWIWFKGNTPFGRWAKRMGHARKSYPSGLQIWVSMFNQSMTKKEAYAQAFAEALRINGVDAYAQSRMD